MNWEAISAISEIVGVTAVMITFIYLAVQIRQNTAAVATSTYESVMTGFNDINIVVASDPALASLLDRGCQNPTTLNAEDVVQFNFLLRCYANQWWKLFKLHERGSLPVAERTIEESGTDLRRDLSSGNRRQTAGCDRYAARQPPCPPVASRTSRQRFFHYPHRPARAGSWGAGPACRRPLRAHFAFARP